MNLIKQPVCNKAYRLLTVYNSNKSFTSTYICKPPSRYNLAYLSGSSMLLRCRLYSANIVLIGLNFLIIQSIICYKNQKHFNQFTMLLLFCVILFYIIFCFRCRFDRCKADIHWMSYTIVFALIRVRKY